MGIWLAVLLAAAPALPPADIETGIGNERRWSIEAGFGPLLRGAGWNLGMGAEYALSSGLSAVATVDSSLLPYRVRRSAFTSSARRGEG